MKASVHYLYFVILALFAGCNDDEISERDIAGVWSKEDVFEDKNRVSKLEYHFKAGNTIELLRTELTLDTREVLGYRHRAVGNYSVSGNKIFLSNLTAYHNDDAVVEYSAIEDLVRTPETPDIEFTFALRGNRELTLTYPPCGPFENCISTIVLEREE